MAAPQPLVINTRVLSIPQRRCSAGGVEGGEQLGHRGRSTRSPDPPVAGPTTESSGRGPWRSCRGAAADFLTSTTTSCHQCSAGPLSNPSSRPRVAAVWLIGLPEELSSHPPRALFRGRQTSAHRGVPLVSSPFFEVYVRHNRHHRVRPPPSQIEVDSLGFAGELVSA